MLHGMHEPEPPETSKWMTGQEVADEFGVSRNTVRAWANSGLIPSYKLPSGRRRYRRADIATMLEASA